MTHLDTIVSAVPVGYMRQGVRLWLEHGVCGNGSFLERLLANDLVGAFGKADAANTANMREWAAWLYNHCPTHCYGSEEMVDAWRHLHAQRRAELRSKAPEGTQ